MEEYKQLKIKVVPSGKYFVWEVYKTDLSELIEESAEEFKTKEDAIQDAKQFIDDWYTG